MKFSSLLQTTALVILSLVNVDLAKAQSCTAMIADSINWLQTSESGYRHYIGFTISGMKAPARFVSYAAGALQLGSAPSRVGLQTILKGSNIMTSFSDRT